MTELDDLEIGISRLKKTSNEQKKIIEELKKERSFLIRKNNEIEGNIKNIQGQIKPTKSEVNELKKELNEVVVLIEDIMKKDSKFQSMLTEQKSNLFLLRSRFEKDMDKALDDIEERIKENKRIELTRFNDLKSKIEKLTGAEDRLKDQDKSQKMIIDKLAQDISKIQQMVTSLTSQRFDVELENLSKRLSSETKSLMKQITESSEIIVGLKDRLQYFEPVIKNLSDSMEKIQLNEARREENFNNMVGRLQELRIRTEDSIKSLNEKITQISKIEGNLERKLRKDNDVIFKRLGSSYDELDERLQISENSISKLGESIKGLGKRLEDQLILLNETGKRLTVLESDVIEQSKSQESQFKGFNNTVKIIDDIEKRLLNSEKVISQLGGLVERIDDLEKESRKTDDLDKRLLISENLISQIEKSIKEIKKFEESYKKDIESRFQKALKDRTRELEANLIGESESLTKDIKSLAKDLSSERERIGILEQERELIRKDILGVKEHLESKFHHTLQGRAKELEADIITRSNSLEEDLKSMAREVSSEKERIVVLEEELKNQIKEHQSQTKNLNSLAGTLDGFEERVLNSQKLTDLSENLVRLEERISDYEKMISHTSEAVIEMRTRIMDEEGIAKSFDEQSKVIDRVTNAGNRLTMLEEKLKAQSSDHDLRFNELIGVIKDLELGETKRIDEFNSFIERFQELKRKTEHNLTLFNQNVKKLSDIKSEIKAEVNKDIENRIKEFGLESEDTKDRVIATEKLLVQLRDTLEELGLNMDSWTGKTKSLELGLKNLTGELTSEKEIRTSLEQRLKSQEKGRELMFANVSNLMRDMELGEANRIREYNNFIAKFREMRTNANEVIKSLKKEKETLNKMSAGFAAKEAKINEKINSFVEDTNSRIKTNEEMYDSEMDAFKNKLDEVIRELITFKEMQKESLGAAKETTVQAAGIQKKEPTVLREPKEPAPIRVEESEPEKPEILAKIKKSEKELL